MAGNQLGKSWSAGFESAMHLTGRYPDWWDGALFNAPIAMWAAGVTSEVTRDSVQRVMCGRINTIGTGSIPKDAIKDKSMKRGVSDAIDTMIIRHGGGGDVQAGESLLGFKSYDQGREKFQAETLDIVWFDEEPDEDIYTEGLTRTNATEGIVYLTFTPLKGMTKVVSRFLVDKMPGTHVTNMTIYDVDHYTDEQREKIIASYPAHERDARVKGIPMMGSGLIFPVPEDEIKENPISIPAHWPRIAGIDFGYDHPTAIAWMAWDRDTDTVHVYDVYRKSGGTPQVHALVLNARGKWIPVAWPHDGENDTAAGPALAGQYKKLGCNFLRDRATHPPEPGRPEGSGGNSVEVGISEMLQRFETGRLRVASHLNDFFEEYRMYHRDKGKIVKKNDDIMSAVRYGIMMLRYARVNQDTRPRIRTQVTVMDAEIGH